jgi:hypothetical protein
MQPKRSNAIEKQNLFVHLSVICYMYNMTAMSVTTRRTSPWLLLVFSLPARRASQRVEIWRKLQRYGTVALKSSGHVLPNTAMNQEKMEWLASAIRTYKGQASVAQVQEFDDLPTRKLKELFIADRTRDYDKLSSELKRLNSTSSRTPLARLNRLRRQFEETVSIDFFGSPARARVETLFAKAEEPPANTTRNKRRAEYMQRLWITRPRPGIDRVSSAWLIRRFIDHKARFVFGEPSAYPDAIPFDMFVAEGFGHRGEDCTFETLCKEFAIRDSRVRHIAQIIHDADLGDEKFGRLEGQALDKVLNGWESQKLTDEQLLQRGMELVGGLYDGLA